MYNFIMTVGTGNCRVCGKQVIFEYEGKTLTTEILDKQKCSDSRCHGVGLLPPRFWFLVYCECVMAYSRCEKCGELRFDDKINLCANCGYRILRTSKSYEWNFTRLRTRAYSRIKVKQ